MSTDAVAPEAVPPDAEPPVTVALGDDRTAVVHFDPALTFECVDDCTWCCHHGVLLYDPDVAALADCADLSATTERFRGERFTSKEDKDREDHVGEDGAACAFLDGDGRCTLHAEHDWKPARCSVFPLAVRREDGVVHVTVREEAHEHCDGLDVSERRVVANLGAFLPDVLWELPNPDTHREL